MTEKQKLELRILVLRFFGDKGKTMMEFRAAKGAELAAEGYDPVFMSKFIYSLATAGLLFDIGGNKGTIYRTTKAGREAIPDFQEELSKYD